VAGRNVFRPYVCAVGPLFAPQRSQQRLPSRTDEKPAPANLASACESAIIASIVTGNCARTGFASRFSSSKRSSNGFASTIGARPRVLVATALRGRFSIKKQPQNRPPAGGYSRISREKSISLYARILAGTAREVFLFQSRDRRRSAPHRLLTS
jgi:hypothetical protein